MIRALLVDDDFAVHHLIGGALAERGGFVLKAVGTGGEALDLAGRERFQIALIKNALPDLPGSMVVRTVNWSAPNATSVVRRVPPPPPVLKQCRERRRRNSAKRSGTHPSLGSLTGVSAPGNCKSLPLELRLAQSLYKD